ncbi:cupin domain-containing protein [Bacteroidota bacterium]
MKLEIKRNKLCKEYYFEEGCYISEISNDNGDEDVSIAQVRVEPGMSTEWHRLTGVSERYLIISGQGRVEVEDIEPADLSKGDVVRIPGGKVQRITNTGETDLIFYAICSPRFVKACYKSESN